MRDKGWNWQVAELSNLSSAVNELKELKRTLPYRNLVQTALYFARLIKDEGDRSLSLSKIAFEVAKTGNTEMALSIAKSIKDNNIHANMHF